MNIALDDNDRCFVAKFSEKFDVYSTNGKHQNTVRVKDPKQQHEIKATVSISITDDGKILVGTVTVHNLWHIAVHDAECTLLKMIPISIGPFYIADVRGTHVAVSDYTVDTVCVYDLQSGKETLQLHIHGAQAICYDKTSNCMLIAGYTKKNYIGEPVPGTGFIDQYCCTTGKVVACIAQGLLYPRNMTFIDDNTLAITTQTTIKLC